MILKTDLEAARARIADISAFCQMHEALSAENRPVSPSSAIACKFCGIGAARALPRVESDRDIRIGNMVRTLQKSAYRLYKKEMSEINDGNGSVPLKGCHISILSVYDDAISELQPE